MKFYVYLWLRTSGIPYYVGKGQGRRALVKGSHCSYPPPRDRIIIQEFDTEGDALTAEALLIALYGKKIDGSGVLRNVTDGGRSGTRKGYRNSEDSKQRCREKLLGHLVSEETREKIKAARARQEISRGYKWSLAARTRLSLVLKGKRNSPKTEFQPGLVPWNKGLRKSA